MEAIEGNKQVLLVNITRMGDLIQMIPLIKRLDREWPGVSIDLVIDSAFTDVARLLPGLRHVWTYNFQALMDDSRARARDVVALYREMAAWAKPIQAIGYDRVINLTFNRRSAYFVAYLDAPDVRGLTTAPDGSVIVRNPWLGYFADLHAYRRLNRWNLVDLYALGGSGIGPFDTITLTVPEEARSWASAFLHAQGRVSRWIAVQVGASDVMKAWRPESFGRTMAMIGRAADVGFILIGSPQEAGAAREAVATYRAAGGTAVLASALGRTTVSQLAALLSHCALMLTNDTGPMHIGVGVGIPVVALSVGHVDVWETGPYGPGHWVIQPDIACGPCGFDQVCPHQTCKDHVLPEQVAAVCLHALQYGPMPTAWSRARLYQSGIDRDGLGTFFLRAGSENPLFNWYGRFWRRVWFELFTGRSSEELPPEEHPPDYHHAREVYEHLLPILGSLRLTAEEMTRVCRQRRLPVEALKDLHARMTTLIHDAQRFGRECLAFSPVTIALMRELHNLSSVSLEAMIREQEQAIVEWQRRIHVIGRRFHFHSSTRSACYASTA